MRKMLSALALWLCALVCVVAATPAYAATQNPVIWADVPDVDVIRVGNSYYMTSTTMHFNPGVPIMKSTDLVNWQIVNYVYDTLDSGDKASLNNGQNEYGKGSWASAIRYKNGRYYVVFGSYTTGRSYIFQTTNIETGPWTKYTLPAMYHDPSLLFDDNGRVFLVYGSNDIRVIELNADATGVKSGGLNQIIVANAGSVAGSGGLGAEGAHIYKINGQYYIFVISWPSGGMRTQSVWRSSSINGSYQGQVILRNAGIAQGGVVDTPDGKWYSVLFQDSGAVGRIPYVIPTTWSNGWPVLANPTDTGISAPASLAFVASDEFSGGSKLGLTWQWNHNPDNSLWSLGARPGYLRLTNGSVRSSILDAKNTLTQRTFGPDSSAIIAMETGNMKNGDYAGLSAFQFYYGLVGVRMSGGTKSIVMMRGSTNNPNQASTPVQVASVPLNQSRVYFKVYTDFRNRTDKASFYYSLDGSQWTAIGSTLQMAYTMPHFVGYRFAIFSYATSSTGGSVDVDFFRVQAGNPATTTAVPTSTPIVPTATRTPTAVPTAVPGTATPVAPTATPAAPTATPAGPTSTPVASAGCQVTYVLNQWGTGFTAEVTVKNTSASAISGWSLAWAFGGNQQVTSAWNATVAQTGASVTASNMSYNASIPAGGSTSFGFQGSYSGTNSVPASFSLNGTACSIAP
ncbi:family 43 glycosylhydrolase [Chloroflexia bacterium SDU3-3]|nr:family 43 glycosylhydrolase [Chloroflexia bacterium SDU3-3]